MALLRNGHSRVYEYGYSLFSIALEELAESKKSDIIDNAFSHRVSKADDQAWKKFVRSNTPKQEKPKAKKQMTKADHIRIINRLRGI